MARISRRRFSHTFLGAVTLSMSSPNLPRIRSEDRRPSLTDIDGLLVGHHTLAERPTGCTVITSGSSFTAGADVRGGAPGTRQIDLLRAENTVDKVDAIILSGGSAFGLDSATGVMKYMEEQGRGVQTRAGRVPIVCSAILYDLHLGDPKIRPDARAGYEAAKKANAAPVIEGNVGAGAGATVGKILGAEHAMKAGLGSWSLRMPDGMKIGALVALNCVGDVIDPATGKIVAGARRPHGGGFLNLMDQLKKGRQAATLVRDNTVLAVVATNASLTKAQCNKVSQMAHDALARCINPSHTPSDGDTVFAVATGQWNSSGRSPDVGLIGALAADALGTAILRAVERAESWGPYPAAKDYPKGKR